MYFCQFRAELLDCAVAKDVITSDDQSKILYFYNNNVMVVRKSDVESLRQVVEFEYVKAEDTDLDRLNDENLTMVRVTAWPQRKNLCLMCSHSDPRIWKYVSENDEDCILMHYVVGSPEKFKAYEFPTDLFGKIDVEIEQQITSFKPM